MNKGEERRESEKRRKSQKREKKNNKKENKKRKICFEPPINVKAKAPATVGAQFREQLNDLMNALMATTPR